MSHTAHDQEWVAETVRGNLKVGFRVTQKLFSEQTPFQKVEVYDTPGYGKMLFNDDVAMLSERDEFIYHDMISHVPLFTHPNPKKVLVIGGGDGGTIREVLRHPSVEKAYLVEIDEAVVRACKTHIPLVASALDDPRCEVRIEDGVKFVKETNEVFDVVIVDSTDPMGPSMPLFSVDFYQDVYRILSDDGLCVSQAESPFYFEKEQRGLIEIKKNVFDQIFVYKYANLAYPGGMWCFSMGSKKYHPVKDIQMEQIKTLNLDTKYYTPDIHKASFVLPNFVLKNLDGLLSQ